MPKKKNKKSRPDTILLYAFGALLFVGAVALLSASAGKSNADFGNVYGYFLRQLLIGLGIGGLAGYAMYKIPYRYFEKMSFPIFAAAIGLMLLVFVPGLGVRGGGAHRWVDFGLFSFQPSEFVKIAFIIYLAAWLAGHIKDVKISASFVPFLILIGMLAGLLIMQPDLSTAIIIALVAGAMYFTAGARWKDVAYGSAIGAAAVYVFVKISPYRMGRIFTFRNPGEDPLGLSYQLNQMLIAVGSGQIWGLGPFRGTQKELVPLAMNDSIYAVWAEETGFIGAVVLILLFLIIAWRGFATAERAGSNFAKFAAIGITVWIFAQAFVNIGAILGMLPITGVTLPLVSYGSSSMVATLMGAGLLLQLSKAVD